MLSHNVGKCQGLCAFEIEVIRAWVRCCCDAAFIVFGKIPPSLLWMWNEANRDIHWQVYHAEKETGSEEKHNNAAISDQIIIYRGVFNEDVSGRATICTSTIIVTCF